MDLVSFGGGGVGVGVQNWRLAFGISRFGVGFWAYSLSGSLVSSTLAAARNPGREEVFIKVARLQSEFYTIFFLLS